MKRQIKSKSNQNSFSNSSKYC